MDSSTALVWSQSSARKRLHRYVARDVDVVASLAFLPMLERSDASIKQTKKQTLFHRVSRANDRRPRFGISHLRFLIYFTNEQSQIPPCHSKNHS